MEAGRSAVFEPSAAVELAPASALSPSAHHHESGYHRAPPGARLVRPPDPRSQRLGRGRRTGDGIRAGHRARPLTGALADRYSRRRIIIICQSSLMVATIAIAGLAFAGTLPLWLLVVLSLASGVLVAIDMPAQTRRSPRWSPPTSSGARLRLSLAGEHRDHRGPVLAGLALAAAPGGLGLPRQRGSPMVRSSYSSPGSHRHRTLDACRSSIRGGARRRDHPSLAEQATWRSSCRCWP